MSNLVHIDSISSPYRGVGENNHTKVVGYQPYRVQRERAPGVLDRGVHRLCMAGLPDAYGEELLQAHNRILQLKWNLPLLNFGI